MVLRQRGLATVEFAVAAMLFFILFFGVIEFARVLFVWNSLAEASRRGARVAVVCPVNHSAVARVTAFNGPGDNGTVQPILQLGPGNVDVDYLAQNGSVIGDPAASFEDIRYVRVSITGYRHHMLLPFFDVTLDAPPFTTVLPRESLGVPREGVAAECFNTTA